MTAMMRATVLMAVAGLALAACSSDKVREGRDVQFFRAMKTALIPGPKPATPHLTRAQIRAMKQPLMLAELPKRDARAYMLKIGQNGDVVTWSTTDAKSVALRNGVVIQTRGLGQDLMSSDLPATATILRGTGTVAATYSYLTGDDQVYHRRYQCSLAHGQNARIEVAQIAYAVREVTESCQDSVGDGFTNRFWIDGRGTIRKSRQWIGPMVGYMDLENLQE